MLNETKQDAEQRMAKSVEALRNDLKKLRTGRASTALVEHLRVDYYGSEVPLGQVAQVSVADARTLTIQPWEKQMVGVVEKAIMTADLGLNPVTAGTLIRIPLPPLSEERRRDLGKQVAHEGENCKVAIRNIRRDANTTAKNLLKDHKVTEDEERRAEAEIQALTDRFVKEIDQIVKTKEQELLEL